MQLNFFYKVTWKWLLICSFSFTQATLSTLFSPDDNPSEKLILLLQGAKKRIYAAVYMITDKTITQELINAKNKRNIDVQIITDEISVTSPWGKGKELIRNNIPVFIFMGDPTAIQLKKNNPKLYINSIMHHKFALIDNTIWAGSFNWTKSANTFNREDVIFGESRPLKERYLQRFLSLKAECTASKQEDFYAIQPKETKVSTQSLLTKLSIKTKTTLKRLFGAKQIQHA